MSFVKSLKPIIYFLIARTISLKIDANIMPEFCLPKTSVEYKQLGLGSQNCIKINNGSQGIIYKCKISSQNVFVVKEITLKKTDNEMQSELNGIIQELNVMNRLYYLDENRIFHRYATFKDKKSCFFGTQIVIQMLEYFNGDLYDAMKLDMDNITPIYIPHKIYLTMLLTRALVRLHNDNFLHLDIKPKNILMRNQYQPVLADFSFSRYVDIFTGSEDKQTININRSFGTLLFAADEVFHNKYGKQTDIYALGVTLFNLWNGQISEDFYINPSQKIMLNYHYRLMTNFCKNKKRINNIYSNIKFALTYHVFCDAYGALFTTMVRKRINNRPIGNNLIEKILTASNKALKLYEEGLVNFEKNIITIQEKIDDLLILYSKKM